MFLSCKVKLDCSLEQIESVRATLAACNSAANVASNFAFDHNLFSKFALQKHTYYNLRSQFGLSAQTAIRVIAKVADSYKNDKEKKHQFKKLGAIAFDARNLSFSEDKSSISIRLLDKRQTIPLVLGDYQKELLKFAKGECDLFIQKNKPYLTVTCELQKKEFLEFSQYLGIDLGIINLAADSHGNKYSGKLIDKVREKMSRLRARLQSKGTKSAKRHLKRLGKKESLFRRDVNHVISKKLVEEAKDTHSCLVLEELTGLGKKKIKKNQRARHYTWAFSQLREFVSYKALRAGVPLLIVYAGYSSQECSVCHCVDKRNRKD